MAGQPIRGIIFDVDGTLVSLKVDVEKLRATTAEALTSGGFDPSFVQALSGLSTQEVIDRARASVEAGAVTADFGALKASLYKTLNVVEMEWNALAEPIPGTAECLSKLRGMSILLVTLTNSGRAPSDWLLRKYGLSDCFDFTLTRDDVPAMKPRPDGVLLALSRMRLQKENVIFVGDSVIDVRAARAAGVRSVSVTTGRYDAQRLTDEGSDYILGSLSALPTLLSPSSADEEEE